MALPQFTVTGNLFAIDGDTTVSILDQDAPTTYRVTFTTNLSPTSDLIAYTGSLYTLDVVYAAVNASGVLVHATMGVGNVLVPDADPIVLVASNGLAVVDFQYRFQLEYPVGNKWVALTHFWFDAPIDGTVIDLADVVPVAGTDRWRGPAASVISGAFDGAGDLVLTNVDGSTTTGITPPASGLFMVDHGDGTATFG